MVIVNNITKNSRHNVAEYDKTHQYVYVIDNAQKMMVILKRDFSKMSEDDSTAEEPVQDFITGKIQSLLDRISDNGPLSLRETELLKYAAMGKSNKQIGEILDLSECTVKNHFSRILRKLKANDRTHAVTMALCNGWLPGLSQIFSEGPESC